MPDQTGSVQSRTSDCLECTPRVVSVPGPPSDRRRPSNTGRSRRSFLRVTDTKAHNIHLRHPELVVQAIRDVVGMARA